MCILKYAISLNIKICDQVHHQTHIYRGLMEKSSGGSAGNSNLEILQRNQNIVLRAIILCATVYEEYRNS